MVITMKNFESAAQKELQAYNDLIRKLNRTDGGNRSFADLSIPEQIRKGEDYTPVPDYNEQSPFCSSDALGDFSAVGAHAARMADIRILRTEPMQAKMLKLLEKMMEQDILFIEARYDHEIFCKNNLLLNLRYDLQRDVLLDKGTLRRQIAQLKANKAKAIRQERADNRRYRSAFTAQNILDRDKPRYEQLIELLKKELDYRAVVNESLLLFYDSPAANKIYQKTKIDACKAAKADARRVFRMRLRVADRQGALVLLDQKTTEQANLAQAHWQMKNARYCDDRVKEALRRDIYRMEGNLHLMQDEIKSLMKKRTPARSYDPAAASLPEQIVSFRLSCIIQEEKARFRAIERIETLVREIAHMNLENTMLPDRSAKAYFGARFNDFPAKAQQQ